MLRYKLLPFYVAVAGTAVVTNELLKFRLFAVRGAPPHQIHSAAPPGCRGLMLRLTHSGSADNTARTAGSSRVRDRSAMSPAWHRPPSVCCAQVATERCMRPGSRCGADSMPQDLRRRHGFAQRDSTAALWTRDQSSCLAVLKSFYCPHP